MYSGHSSYQERLNLIYYGDHRYDPPLDVPQEESAQLQPISSRITIQRFLRSHDPGLIRLESACRAALAVLTAWYGFNVIADLIGGPGFMGPRPYAPISCILCFLVVVDRWPPTRFRTTLLCLIPAFGSLVVLWVIPDRGLFELALILALVFLSFAVRRYSVVVGSLLLYAVFVTTTMRTIPIDFDDLDWYLFAAAFGVGSAILWQFVIWRHPPGTLVNRVLEDVRTGGANALRSGARVLAGAPETSEKAPERGLIQMRRSRQSVLSEVAIFQAPSSDVAKVLRQIVVSVNKFDRGIRELVDTAAQIHGHSSDFSNEVRARISGRIDRLAQFVEEPSSKQARESLRSDWTEFKKQFEQQDVSMGGGHFPVGHLAGAAFQVFEATDELNRVQEQLSRIAIGKTSPDVPASPQTAKKRPPVPGMHPTIALAIQATVATALTMLVAHLLDIDHANWAFLTAFSVVAGSAGQSIQRIGHRVYGTVIGVMSGLVLAVLADGSSLILPLIVAACVGLIVFFALSSYPLMVASLTALVALLFVRLGSDPREILVERTIDTLIGAAIGGVVVLTVFPIHAGGRIALAAAGYIASARAYLEASNQAIAEGCVSDRLKDAEIATQAAFQQLRASLPAATFEYRPLSQARSKSLRQASNMASFNIALSAVFSALDQALGSPLSPRVQRAYQSAVADIQLLLGELTAELSPSDPVGGGPRTAPDRPVFPSRSDATLAGEELTPSLVYLMTAVTGLESSARELAR